MSEVPPHNHTEDPIPEENILPSGKTVDVVPDWPAPEGTEVSYLNAGVFRRYKMVDGTWRTIGGDLPVYQAPDDTDVSIAGGNNGASVGLFGGAGATDDDGGDVLIDAADGDGTGNGGDLRFQSGQGGTSDGNGGLVNISAGRGNGSGTGGNMLLEAGQGGVSNGSGGNAELRSGAGHGTNDAGHVILRAALSNGGVGLDGSVVIASSRVPTSASDVGIQGAFAYDSDYIYICVATDTWKRVAISTW